MPFSHLFFFSLVGAALSFNCSVPPIYIDVHVRGVHGSNALEYGSFAGFGTASQNESLWMSLNRNETSVAAIDYCKNTNTTDCDKTSGGLFEPGSSTS